MAKRVLVTGVAGSGKTTLYKLFKDKGFVAVDIDDGYAVWRHAETDEILPYNPEDEDWHAVAEWAVDTEKLQKLFDAHPSEVVLVFGSFARMRKVVSMFDKVLLLEYPNEATVRERIAGREGGYGKNAHELVRILSYVQPYQQKMKALGAEAIDCTSPIK